MHIINLSQIFIKTTAHLNIGGKHSKFAVLMKICDKLSSKLTQMADYFQVLSDKSIKMSQI